MDTVYFQGAGPAASKVPLIFMWGVQARRSQFPEGGLRGLRPELQAIAKTAAVVFMQTYTEDNQNPDGALYLVDPNQLKMAPAGKEADTKDLRQIAGDQSVLNATLNLSRFGQLERNPGWQATNVNIPSVDAALIGASDSWMWLRTKEDCV